MIDDTNYVIYHRNNYMLGLTNHIDKDGDLDPNYAMLRNTGLTGNKKRLIWLKECATKGCPICGKIFSNKYNKNDLTISEWYNKNVVVPQRKMRQERKQIKQTKPIENQFDKLITGWKTQVKDNNEHPLLQKIKAKFLKGE